MSEELKECLTPDELQAYGAAVFEMVPSADFARKVIGDGRWKHSLMNEKGPIINAADLMNKKFSPLRWTVPGILPEGCFLFAGKSKLGKSWVALELAIAVASGGRALRKVQVEAGRVLYLALEDTQRRLQARISKLIQDDPEVNLENLDIITALPRGDDGCAYIRRWLGLYPSARLVIIDTFAKFRAPSEGRTNIYEADYLAVGMLKELSDYHRVSVLMVHHTRKAAAEDVLDTVNGSTGLNGAADGTLIMTSARDERAVLYVVGRDIEEDGERALKWDSRPGYVGWMLDDPGYVSKSALGNKDQIIVDIVRSFQASVSYPEIIEALGSDANDLGSEKAISKRIERVEYRGILVREALGLYRLRGYNLCFSCRRCRMSHLIDAT